MTTCSSGLDLPPMLRKGISVSIMLLPPWKPPVELACPLALAAKVGMAPRKKVLKSMLMKGRVSKLEVKLGHQVWDEIGYVSYFSSCSASGLENSLQQMTTTLP